MHYSAIAIAVATLTVVGGQAFLIPPNINPKAASTNNNEEFALMALDGSSPGGPNNRVLKAACKGCLADGNDGALIYDLVITNLGTPKFLLNGADLTPLDLRPGHLESLLEITMPPPYLSVPLVGSEETLSQLAATDLKPKEVKVVYNSYSEIQQLGDGEVVKMILEATSVDGRVVKGGNVDKVEVRIVMEAGGKMVILDAGVMAGEDDEGLKLGHGEKCGFLCEVLEKVVAWGKKAEQNVEKWGNKVGHKVRPCGKNANGKVVEEKGAATATEESVVTGGNAPEAEKDAKKDDDDEQVFSILPIAIPEDRTPPETSSWRRPPYSRPHRRPHHGDGDEHRGEGHRYARPWSHHNHGGHQHHHNRPHFIHHPHRSGAAKVVLRVLVQVLVPIAVGVFAGMFVSLMGMVVGHFAVVMWQKVFGKPKDSRITEVGDKEEVHQEEAKGLLVYRDEEEGEAPPPQYEGEGKGVTDEKM